MRIHLYRKLTFIISCLLIFTTVSGCTTTPTTYTTPVLEEKTLPPVFSDINVLKNKYWANLIFPPIGTSNTSENDYLPFTPVELPGNSSPSTVPDKLIAYKVIRPVVTKDYASNLASRLGFRGKINRSDNTYINTYSYILNTGTTDIDPAMSISGDGRIEVSYDRSVSGSSPPSDQECIESARKWLNTYGLYPKGVVNVEVLPCVREVYRDAPEGLTFSSYTYATTVIFSMTLDGYELFGMGAILTIGSDGKVREALINAPEFKPYCYVNVKQPEAAYSTLQDYVQNPAKFEADAPECMTGGLNPPMQIKNVSLKYFAMLAADTSKPVYAQPVYFFNYTYIMVDAVLK